MKMQNRITGHPGLKSNVKTLLILVVFLGVPVTAYRSCTSGYDQYAYFVRVSDESVFKARLKPSDKRILERGRRLTAEVNAMDQETDSGDGPKAGKLRWYVCSGIDCDEGWEKSFLN